jgi:hypothetical protein
LKGNSNNYIVHVGKTYSLPCKEDFHHPKQTAICMKTFLQRHYMPMLISLLLSPLFSISQVTTNSGSGLAANYPSLDAGITALNAATITGSVTITLTGNETAPVGGYSITAEGTAVNTITIQGSGSTITTNGALVVGTLNDAVFKLVGADYITLQNFTLQENAANTTAVAATNNMTEWGVALLATGTTNGAQNNTIKNNTISLNRTYGNSIGIYSNVRHSPTVVTTLADIVNNTTAPNNTNKVYTNAISNVSHGIVFVGSATAANEDTGNDIGGYSAATGNTITNYGGLAATTAYVGYSTTIYSGIYINNENNANCSYNTATTASLSSTIAFRGIIASYDVVPVGTIVNNVNNNTITVTNASTGGLQCITGGGVAGLSGVTLNMNSNKVINCAYTGGLAVTMFGIANVGTYGTVNISSNQVYGNTSNATTGGFIGITNQGIVPVLNVTNNEVGIEGTGAVTMSAVTSAGITGFSNTTANGTTTISGNYFRGFSLVSSGQLAGIINSGAFTTAMNILNNHIGTSTSNFVTYSAASAGNFFGIVNAAGAAAGTLTITGNDITGVVHNVAGSGGLNFYNNQVFTGSTNISNNTITNIVANTTGTAIMFSNSVTHAANTTHNVNNNSIVGTFNRITLTGAITFYNAFGTSPASVTEINTGNNISNVTFAGTTTSFGWRTSDGTTPGSHKTITNNTFSNITGGTGNISSILLAGTSDNTFNGTNVSGNTISNITSAGNIACLVSADGNQNFFNNTISGISSTGAAAVVTGISFSGGTVQNVYKNKVYNLQADGATATVNGILVSAGTTLNIYNNLIGDLRAPSTNAITDAIRGINITSTTATSNINVYYNTVNLAATSTGTDFSTSGIFHTGNATATTATLDLRNNIIVNNSTPNGTGFSVAYARSSGAANMLANYAASSNNNLFYAGTPSSNHLIYNDGSSSAQDIASYKAGVFTAGTIAPRDQNSITENPSFLSTVGSSNSFLHINPSVPSAINGAAVVIGTITDDYDAQTRNLTTPDIGADEYDFAPLVWNGVTSTAWTTATNWTPNLVPVTNSAVSIPSGTPFAPTSNALVTLSDLSTASTVTFTNNGLLNVVGTLANDGSITGTTNINGTTAQTISGTGNVLNLTLNNAAGASITAGSNKLNINGALTLTSGTLTTNGNLVLKSTASSTARIAAITGGSINGTATMETYIPGGTRAFRFLGHPFTTVQNMGSLIDNIYITGAGAGFDATTTNNPSAYWYDNTATTPGTWTAFSSTSDNNWAQYRGARVLVRGDRTQTTTLTGSNPTPLPVTLDMTGTLNTGNASIALPTANAYHLIGNPYPSPTDIGTVVDATANIGTLYWVWKASTAPRGAYVPLTVGSGAYNLAMGASFFVRPTANTTLAFTEGNKSASTNDNLFRTFNVGKQLELELQYNNDYADKLFVRFDKDAKATVDMNDGDKLINQDINFYALSADNKKLTLDARPFNKDGSIPLGFTSTIASAYTIKVLNNGLDANMEVYLKDKLLNRLTKLETGTDYGFEVTAGNAASQGENRFELVMKQAPVLLPLTTSFTVKLSPNPATDMVKVSFSNTEKSKTTISIIDAAGRMVKTVDAGIVQSGEANINVKGLSKGSYLVTIDNGNERKTTKLIIE